MNANEEERCQECGESEDGKGRCWGRQERIRLAQLHEGGEKGIRDHRPGVSTLFDDLQNGTGKRH